MKTDQVFLLWSMSRFDEQYSSAILSLAKSLSREKTVIYVDYPFTLKDRVSNKHKQAVERRDALMKKSKNGLVHRPDLGKYFYVFLSRAVFPVNWLPEGTLYDYLSEWNDRFFLEPQKEMLAQLDYEQLILLNSFAPLYGKNFERYLSPDLVIYQCRDWIAEAPYVAKHGKGLEKWWIKRADFCLGTSTRITRYLKEYNPNSYLLANAANYELFANKSAEIPNDIASLKGVKVLYTGNIGHRMNWELVKQVIEKHKDKHFVFAGPVTVDHPVRKALQKQDNVHFIGQKKLEELPPYLHHCDILWIPFQINNLTAAIYPLKLQEYFAAGKPVWVTHFSEDLDAFEQGLYFIDEKSEFEILFEKSLNEKAALPELRRKWASENTWENRKVQFLQRVANFLKKDE